MHIYEVSMRKTRKEREVGESGDVFNLPTYNGVSPEMALGRELHPRFTERVTHKHLVIAVSQAQQSSSGRHHSRFGARQEPKRELAPAVELGVERHAFTALTTKQVPRLLAGRMSASTKNCGKQGWGLQKLVELLGHRAETE
jgi:hypothetical protein